MCLCLFVDQALSMGISELSKIMYVKSEERCARCIRFLLAMYGFSIREISQQDFGYFTEVVQACGTDPSTYTGADYASRIAISLCWQLQSGAGSPGAEVCPMPCAVTFSVQT